MNNPLTTPPPIILIVDDDPDQRRLIRRRINNEGYEFYDAASGEEALALYPQVKPDAVLLDAVMGEISGFETCRRIRQMPTGADVPILMITSLNDSEAIEQAFGAGATDYLRKPIRWLLLQHRLRRLIAARRSQMALSTTEYQLEKIVQHGMIAVCVIDREGIITFARGRILDDYGLFPSSAIGSSIYRPEPGVPYIAEEFNQALGGITSSTILPVQQADRMVEYHFSPTLTLNGDIAGVVLVVTDVTEQHRKEQTRLEAERQRVQVLHAFISAASHDLKTPLSTLNTALYLLEKSTTPERRAKHMATLKSQTQRLTQLIEDMLVMSRLDGLSPTELEFRQTELKRLVTDIVKSHQDKAIQYEIALLTELAPYPQAIWVSEEYVSLAIKNLLDNALNYTPTGGQVKIETWREGMYQVVEVADTGLGITSKDLEQVYDRFYRAASNRPTDTGGTGLGLSIVKRIMELHSGHIEIISEPNIGTQARLYFVNVGD